MADGSERDVTGRVVEALPNGMFRVELDNGDRVVAHVASKMRLHFVQILPGDAVSVELSPYDRSRAKVTRRIER